LVKEMLPTTCPLFQIAPLWAPQTSKYL
jgi:hypothetical protein